MESKSAKKSVVAGLPNGISVSKIQRRGKTEWQVRLGLKFVGRGGTPIRRFFGTLAEAKEWIFAENDGASNLRSAVPGPVAAKEVASAAVQNFRDFEVGAAAVKRAKDMGLTIDEVFALANKYRAPESGVVPLSVAIESARKAKHATLRPHTRWGLFTAWKRFAKEVGQEFPIHAITRDLVLAHVRKIGGGTINTRNHIRTISSLLSHCQAEGWLSDNPLLGWKWKAALGIQRTALGERKTPRVFTVAEARSVMMLATKGCGPLPVATTKGKKRLFTVTPGELIPYYAIMMFAGVRPVETERLTWEDIFFDGDEPHIHVPTTKGGMERLVPLEPVLIEWLRPFIGRTGQIVPESFDRKKAVFSRSSVFLGKWSVDICRHSYASYLVRLGREPHLVAVAMGHRNTSAVLWRHYLTMIKSRSDAEAYFALTPSSLGL